MMNFSMCGCAKAAGLAALSFCIGVIAGMFFPIAFVAIVETILLVIFGYLCLFKW